MNTMKIFILSILIIAISGRYGIDINQVYTDDSFTCFAQQGISYAVVQAYQPHGGRSPQAQQNLRQAQNRGFNTDIYMNFCNSKDPVTQVKDMFDAFSPNLYGTVWIRVEENSSPGCSLTLNTPQRSCDYLKAIIGYVQSKGKYAGIYSTISFWKKVFGSTSFCYQIGAGLNEYNRPLWYGSDDGVASFQGFQTFGGWKYSYLKTYKYGATVCGLMDINLNWSPKTNWLQKQ